MIHNFTGAVHLIAAVISIVFGAGVFSSKKGTGVHKILGYGYVVSMAVAIASSFNLYLVTGGLNALHVASFVSAATITFGLWAVLTRKEHAPTWYRRHYITMSWSYIGLIVALISETATRTGLPWLAAHGIASGLWFWMLISISTGLVVAVGAWLLHSAEFTRQA